MKKLFSSYSIDGIIHLAAESHVDRSITDPLSFVKTNVYGTLNLLEVAKIVGKTISKENCFIIFLRMRSMEA